MTGSEDHDKEGDDILSDMVEGYLDKTGIREDELVFHLRPEYDGNSGAWSFHATARPLDDSDAAEPMTLTFLYEGDEDAMIDEGYPAWVDRFEERFEDAGIHYEEPAEFLD